MQDLSAYCPRTSFAGMLPENVCRVGMVGRGWDVVILDAHNDRIPLGTRASTAWQNVCRSLVVMRTLGSPREVENPATAVVTIEPDVLGPSDKCLWPLVDTVVQEPRPPELNGARGILYGDAEEPGDLAEMVRGIPRGDRDRFVVSSRWPGMHGAWWSEGAEQFFSAAPALAVSADYHGVHTALSYASDGTELRVIPSASCLDHSLRMSKMGRWEPGRLPRGADFASLIRSL